MSTTTLVILVAAMVLLYSAVKNKNPQDVIKGAFQKKAPSTARTLGTN